MEKNGLIKKKDFYGLMQIKKIVEKHFITNRCCRLNTFGAENTNT